MRFRIAVNTKLWLLVQNCFVVIGVTASGAVTGPLVVFTLVRALFASEKLDLLAAILELVFIPVALLLGGIAGCVVGISWVRQHGSSRWGTATWAGMLLGLFLGLTGSSAFFGNSNFHGKLATVLVSAASATLVGTAVSYVAAFRNDSKNRS
jgi:di/tricarboxylate transporter